MGGVGSGGGNRISAVEHQRRGTFRADRHAEPLPAEPAKVQKVSSAARRRALAGLSPESRRIAGELMASFGNWDAGMLATLRSYVQSLERIAALEASNSAMGLHAELRLSIALRRVLDLG